MVLERRALDLLAPGMDLEKGFFATWSSGRVRL